MTMETEAAQEAAEDQSFDEAFAEFAAGREEPDVQEEPDEQEPTAPEAEPQSDDPLTQQAGESNEDFTARLNAAEKAATEWEHKFKSEVGRQTALQRKVQELEAQLQAQPQNQQAQKQYSQRMKGLMDDYPEIAEALQAELEESLAAVRAEVQAAVAPMKKQEEQRRYEAEEQTVKARYPDFVDVVNSKEFLDWFNEQPDAVQALAASPNARDAIAVMDYFSANRRPVAANPEVQNIQAKRQQALEKHVSIRNSAAAPVADGPDDFEAFF
jgi:hypothetical protein